MNTEKLFWRVFYRFASHLPVSYNRMGGYFFKTEKDGLSPLV